MSLDKVKRRLGKNHGFTDPQPDPLLEKPADSSIAK
jgi:hypothetical protein